MLVCEAALLFLTFRVFYIQAFESERLQSLAYEQQTRDRLITPDRGVIYDRNMKALATTETVYSISVIRAQIKDAETVARILSEMLELDYDKVLEKCRKRVALERVKMKVDKKIADEIRALGMDGVIVDEDIKRIYPYSTLASQIIGFVGRDNQGIIGLEAKYDSVLAGSHGKILTETDASGINVDNGDILRIPPETGNSLVTSIDVIIQQYAEQTISKIVEAKNAERGLIIVMNPQNGEIYAIANEPGFDLNDPFTICDEKLAALWETFDSAKQMEYLNAMWRNFAINDTYEPGSTFKIVTSSAGLQEGVINEASTFNCAGGLTVGGRYIRCWLSPRSHGTLNFIEGVQKSCNPVFMITAERLGAEKFYEYLLKFGFDKKTGVDLPGEAVGIMHKLENIGSVELATMGFGQSFQITPLQLMTAVSAAINGGYLITPRVGSKIIDKDGNIVENLVLEKGESVIDEKTSELMREILESVVEFGTGNRTYIPGYRIGGKTATSEKLPRGGGKYISSFLTIAPAEEPVLAVLVLVDEPEGAHYGGQVAGPAMKELLENVLPYMGIEPIYSEEELKMNGVGQVGVPDFSGLDSKTVKKMAEVLKISVEFRGEEGEDVVVSQFPAAGELVNQGAVVILNLN